MTKVIRHGAYHVTRNGQLAFVQQTKCKCEVDYDTFILGWLYVEYGAETYWVPFSWLKGGASYLQGTRSLDIIGRWKGKRPAKLPMEKRESYFIKWKI